MPCHITSQPDGWLDRPALARLLQIGVEMPSSLHSMSLFISSSGLSVAVRVSIATELLVAGLVALPNPPRLRARRFAAQSHPPRTVFQDFPYSHLSVSMAWIPPPRPLGLPARHLANNTTDLLVRYNSIHPRTHQRAQFRAHPRPTWVRPHHLPQPGYASPP